MALSNYTCVVLQRADGSRELLTRAGHVQPAAIAREVEARSPGAVVHAVRHETLNTPDGRRRAVNIFPMHGH